jgi:hypothetical protein
MSSYSRCVSCTCCPLRWPARGRHPPGDGAQNIGFGRCERSSSPRWNPRRVSRLAVSLQQGSFDAAFLTSVILYASRKHPSPRFGPGSGEARCDNGRACVVTCGVASCRTKASAPVRDNAFIELRASGFVVVRACPSDSEDSLRTPSGVLPETGNVADWFEPVVALPRKYAPSSSRSGSRRLAAVVTL